MSRKFAQSLRKRMSALEKRAWELLKALRPEGIHVRRQHPVGRYSADFAIMRARLAIEIDGPLHEDPAHRENDKRRDEYFNNAGWRVLRVVGSQLNDELAFLTLVRAAASPSPRGEGAGGGVKRDESEARGNLDDASSPKAEFRPTPQPPPLAGRGSEPLIPTEAQRRTRANRKLKPRRKA